MEDKNQNSHNVETILKELSDIKASLAVNTNETANIKASVAEIKSDMKEIKNDFVTRREFNEALKEVREQIKPLKKFLYGLISVVGVGIIGAVLKLIFK